MINIPEKQTIHHGGYEDLRMQLEKMDIGDKVTVQYILADGVRTVAKRCGITIAQRRNGDQLDIYKINEVTHG